jgi:hypothetical protein
MPNAAIAIALIAPTLLLQVENASAGESRFEVELEGGAVWQTKNDVQIPNDDSATRFSLVDLVGRGPAPAGRVTLTWNPSPRHALCAIGAPLQFVETGTPAGPVSFAGATFPAGEEVEATYRFNSWRLGYRYRVAEGARSRWWIGVTAKLRDAEVKLSGNGRSAKDTDLGFVPLLHLAGNVRLSQKAWLGLDADGLAGGPGRAIDAAARIGYDVGDHTAFAIGYRTLEGGADVDSVYNFAWLHYAVASVTWRTSS